jgi:serine/threonine protein kinase
LFELSTLNLPFEGRTKYEIEQSIISGIFKPGSYSIEMDILIGKCLRKEADKRITVNEILQYPLIANHDKDVFRFI